MNTIDGAPRALRRAAGWLACGAMLIAMASAPPATAQGVCTDRLRIGAWNIEHFGEPGSQGKQDPADLASYIAKADVDVLALEEIAADSTHPAKGRRSTRLDQVMSLLGGVKGTWDYVLLDKRLGESNPNTQLTGVMWNTSRVSHLQTFRLEFEVDPKVEASIAKKIKSTDPKVIWRRWPHAVWLSAGEGKTDFFLVPLHMKSNRDKGDTPSARAYEVQLLLSALKALSQKTGEQDIILAGDTNMKRGTEPAGVALGASGYRDCNARDLGTYLESTPFDRIYVLEAQPETKMSCPKNPKGDALDFIRFLATDWRPGMKKEDFVASMSDHVLVRTAVCVMKDDDK